MEVEAGAEGKGRLVEADDDEVLDEEVEECLRG